MATAIEKRLADALEDMHDAANGGAGAGYAAPPALPDWYVSEMHYENCDEGPDMASDFLENPSTAESVLVTLGKTDGNTDIVPANELDAYVTVYGLYNLAELGFTDEEADTYLGNLEAEAALDMEVSHLESRVAEMEGGIERSESLLYILEPTGGDLSDIREEKEMMEAEHAMLKEQHAMCKAELDATLTAIHVFRKRVRRAVVASRKPLKTAVLVRELLRKYEEEAVEVEVMESGKL
jgi:hypothetical protein